MVGMNSLEGKTVCVVDAYGLLYQVFYAKKMEMTNTRGEPTGATFGFARDVLSMMTSLPIDYLFCAYDMRAKTFRSDIFQEYKANRSATPDDLLLQFDFSREFLKGVAVPALGLVGYEADDVMATLSQRVKELGGKTIIVTSDKDARQLLDDATSIYLIRKNAYYTPEDLKKDWGVAPSQVVDFQALVGDSVDNVPGVPGIGPKSAGELLKQFGNLDAVLEAAGTLKGKKYENIAANKESALLSRELVKLRRDIPIEIDWNAGKLDGIDPERLVRLFQYWNFKSLEKRINELVERFGRAQAEPSEWFDRIENMRNERMSVAEPTRAHAARQDESFDVSTPLAERLRRSLYGAQSFAPSTIQKEETLPENKRDSALIQTQYSRLKDLPLPTPAPRDSWRGEVVDTEEKLDALVNALASVPLLSLAAITLEEPDLGRVRARTATLAGLALAAAPEKAFYLPLRAPLGYATVDFNAALEKLRPIFENAQILKLGFELKYDALALLTSGIKLRGIAFDAALADYLALAGETRRTLDDLASTYLDARLYDLRDALGAGRKRVTLDAVAPETVAMYAADKVLASLNAAPILRDRLLETPALEKLALDLETPLVEALVEMEYNGVAIDPEVFRQTAKVSKERQEVLESEIREIVRQADPDPHFAQEINLNSPKQLQRLLFDDLKLPVIKKTKTGPSVDAEVLEELSLVHEVPEKIVELRKLVKLCGTYLEPLPRQTTPGTNRVSATFNQASTATGRLSSSDPNLQNIPARSQIGKEIRSGFIPDATQGFDALLSCDYSQIELRILAHFSNDAALLRAFQENRDVHASVAAQIFGVAEEDVDADMRRKAKAVNFGLVYGQTPFGLSKSIGVSREAAADYIDKFFETYPSVLVFFDRVLEDCAKRGYVETLLGRRRALEGVRGARGRKTLNFPERAAINAVVQGSAADVMKLAMLSVWRRLRREGWIVSHWAPDDHTPTPLANVSDATSSTTPLFNPAEYQLLEFQDGREDQREKTPTPHGQERARLLLQIHDELLFETRREDADELAKIVVEEMKLNNPLNAPLQIDAEIGANWGEL